MPLSVMVDVAASSPKFDGVMLVSVSAAGTVLKVATTRASRRRWSHRLVNARPEAIPDQPRKLALVTLNHRSQRGADRAAVAQCNWRCRSASWLLRRTDNLTISNPPFVRPYGHRTRTTRRWRQLHQSRVIETTIPSIA